MDPRSKGPAAKGPRKAAIGDAGQPDEFGLGHAGLARPATPETPGTRAAELEATVDGKVVSELFCLFRGQVPFLITPSGTHDFAKLFFFKGTDGLQRFSLGALDGFNRIGPEAVSRADLDTTRGLVVTTKNYRVFVHVTNLQATWR